MKISAAIFDLNGTILDDEDIYNASFNIVLKRLGVDVQKPIPHEHGIGVTENWVHFIKNLNIKTDKLPEILAKETQEEYLKQLSEITVRPGFEELVEGFKDVGIQIGLATSNTWEVTMNILEKLNLFELFDAITTAEEVRFNKPDPDLFLVAADKLGVDIGGCLVIEDAPSGVEAAHRAGMKVVAICEDEKYAEKLTEADRIVESFSEITPKVIDQL